MKSPAFQFYPGDWRRDLPLRYCSLAARGLWIELMCLMHDGSPYGHLSTEREPILDPKLIAKLVGSTPGSVARAMTELEHAGVLSKTEDGVIYSRRMVRDQGVRERRAAGGYRSLEHPGVPKPKDTLKDTLKDTSKDILVGGSPASASASASALKTETPNGVLSGTARRCLSFLNEKTGRTYRPVRVNLELIEARLKDGATEANVRGVIARKCRDWQGTEMSKYLRPATLFNRTKFEQYLGERPPEAVNGLPAMQ